MIIVSAHQPNFFPYEGVLDKCRASNRHIILTHCQFERGGFQNRFRLRDRWLTMPTSQNLEPIVKKHYSHHETNWSAIKRKLPYYASILSKFDPDIGPSLVETNVAILRRICAMLNIKTEIVMDYPTPLIATDRLVDLCKHYSATTYLSGPSGPKYMQMEKFAAAEIEVRVQGSTSGRAAVELLKDATSSP